MAKPSARSDRSSGKGMRKGTHSCVECRRRKLRCVFPANDVTCFSCAARKSRCVRQGSTPDDAAEAVVPHDTSRRGRSGRLRATKLAVTTPAEARHGARSPSQHDLPDESPRAPLVSLFRDANLSARSTSEGHVSSSRQETAGKHSRQQPQSDLSEVRRASVCATIRSKLPSYDKILSIFSSNGFWWSSFRQKTHVLSETRPETIEDFARRTYTSSQPAELGTLAVAVARSSSHHGHLCSLVEDVIISNSAFIAMPQGIECIVLLARTYTDEAQPKKAWIVWRKGLMAAQLMGLTFGSHPSPIEYGLWMTIYHGDRFCSMLLGLPYGVNDHSYKHVFDAIASSMTPASHFVLRCAVVSGKVIDRNLIQGRPSLAGSMELDQELDAATSLLPAHWWTVTTELPLDDSELDDLRDRLLVQFYFFWIKLYIHLPFLVRHPDEPPPNSSEVCMEAARQILRRYKMLRATTSAGHSLFECKTTDFSSFTAAVALVVGISYSQHASQPQDVRQDLELIASVDDILRREETENGSQIASQCRTTLKLLLGRGEESEAGSYADNGIREIVIPYFGVVVRKPVDRQAPSQPGVACGAGSAWLDLVPDHSSSEPNQSAGYSDMEGTPWGGDDLFIEYIQPAFPSGYAEFGLDDALSWFGDAEYSGFI